jgi:hypothetical protein
LEETPALETNEAIAAQQWFPLDNLPPKEEVAHHGWANLILKKMKIDLDM